MGVYSLLLRRGVDIRTRFQAFLNLLCSLYMTVLVVVVTSLGFFHIVPACYGDRPLGFILHRLSMGYCLLSCISHYVTCIWTDPSVKPDSGNKSYKPHQNDSSDTTPIEDVTSRQTSVIDHEGLTDGVSSITKNAVVYSDVKITNADANGKPLKRKRGNVESKRDVTKDKQTGAKRPRRPRRDKRLDFYCSTCDHYIPDRVHHCYLCETCIEKRDHHCFFMGVCIGQTNQKYFIYFTLFMGIGTMYGLAMISKYLHVMYNIQFHGPQTFVTLFAETFLNVFTGRTPTPDFMIHFFCMYASLFGTMFAFSFFAWQVMIVYYGQTTHEARQGITRFSKPTVMANLTDVLGDRFLFCLRSLVIPFADLVLQ